MSLLDMLRYRRPHGSKTEREFINTFIRPLSDQITQDTKGNLLLRIPNADGSKSNVMWSSHTDTVHREGGYQSLTINRDYVWTEDPQSNCLGADCTTGVWLMVEMIKAGKPGLYVFHREEEIGRKGSIFINDKTPEVLEGIDFCIAFDRKGTGSIITKQTCGVCCSEDFSKSLAAGLDLGLKSDPTGSYTDSASYVTKIPECTNLSVGYYSQHSSSEYQDLRFANVLRDRLIALDTSKLVVKRDPNYKPPTTNHYHNGYGYNQGRRGGYYGDWDWRRGNDLWDDGIADKPVYDVTKIPDNLTMEELVTRFPNHVASLLRTYGLSYENLKYAIQTEALIGEDAA